VSSAPSLLELGYIVNIQKNREIKFGIGGNMFESIIIILVILWALGFFAFHVGSGLIHLLLVVAVIVFIFRMMRGRKG